MEPDEPSPPSADGTRPDEGILIVGVGASAGGLEALTALVHELTADSMAFVVVQHLSPSYPSMLPAILGRETGMPVLEIADGVRVEANHIYVAPPNVNVTLLHGVLHLVSPRAAFPIDYFFRSLAQDRGARSVGVVLSGMGSDGTLGLREIKAQGGLTFCQDPSTAKQSSMPESALESGSVDRSLPAAELGAELMALSHHRARRTKSSPPAPNDLGRLFVLLRAAFGNDLSLYKQTTIARRIERRLALNKVGTLADYVRLVQEDAAELRALYKDLLISVTSFFRDSEPFLTLEKQILPALLARKAHGEPIRVWAPACATGEEAYSLAICFLEAIEASGQSCRLQVFGTDVDESAITRARLGVFPASIAMDVSAPRLERFFTRVDAGYQIARRVRDILVFSTQNVVQDPPFSRLDLVSCRNVLIYLQAPLQKRVLRILHYALRPDGYLLLGNSETVGESADLFSLLDRKNKVYVKKNLPASLSIELPSPGGLKRDSAPLDSERRPALTAQQLADRKVLERYAPPSVLVDENFEVLQFRGDMGPFLSPAPGAATLQLMKLVRPELHLDLWRALQQALESGAAVRISSLRTEPLGDTAPFAVGIHPISDPETRSRCLLVVFELGAAPSEAHPRHSPPGGEADPAATSQRVSDLEEELQATKEYLQTAIEELEASNEELKSTNEELQSSNEELQSTNEELETSKEELQSTNEELSSLNDENQKRMTETAQTKADLSNLLARIDESAIFVGADLRVRRMAEQAKEALGLSAADLGRPLSQLRSFFGDVDLEAIVKRTLDRLEAGGTHFRAEAGRWYELRSFPYRTADDRLDGALIVVRDVHEEKRRRELVLNVEDYAAKLLAAIPNALLIVDESLRVIWANGPFLDYFQTTEHETLGNLVHNLGSGQWGHPQLRARMEEALSSGRPFKDFRIEHSFETLGKRQMRIAGSRLEDVGDARRALLLSIEDASPHVDDPGGEA